jgi:sucrose-6-phosphate hydrolase SacC (GH32 family)
MAVPRKLSLKTTPEGIRLLQEPLDAIGELRETALEVKHANMDQANQKLGQSQILAGRTFELKASIAMGAAQEAGWRLLESDGASTVVGYDRRVGKLFVDRTHSGLINFSKDFPVRVEAPLRLASNVLQLDILVDRNSVEVFAEGGRVALTNLVFPPAGARTAAVYAKGGAAGSVNARVWSLRSIYAR